MIKFSIPGFEENLNIEHLLLDYNGSLAEDGKLLPSAKKMLNELSNKIHVHVITADTFGIVKQELEDINLRIKIIQKGEEAPQKLEYLKELGANSTICIGNGRNDVLMLQEAVIGIVVLNSEGTAIDALHAADILCDNIKDAFDLVLNPMRMRATLRK